MDTTRVDARQARPVVTPEYFDGAVRMQTLYEPDRDGEESELIAVFFDAGARNRPHVHESTQVLHVVSGRCLIVTEGGRRTAEAGEYVTIPRGTWHWHGATGGDPMCHISIKLPGRTNWDVPLRDWERG